jgi:hypothetical protein
MSDRVSKKVCLDGNLFIEVYVDNQSYFVIVYNVPIKFGTYLSGEPFPFR